MALDKTVTQRGALQGKVVGKDNELRVQLVDLYKERVVGVDFASLDLKGTVEAFSDREHLANHLKEQGKERESNTIRKETIHVLVSKAEAAERQVLEIMAQLKANTENYEEQRATLGAELTGLTERLPKLQYDFKALKEQHATLDPDSAEAKELKVKMDDLNVEYKESAKKATELQVQLRQMSQEEQMQHAAVQHAAEEALTLKSGAASVMMVMGNADGAFELALETVDKFHNVGLFGMAENFVANVIKMAEGTAEQLYKDHKPSADIHKLLELGLEISVDVSVRLEKAVFSGDVDPELLEGAVQFRLKAADLSAKMGNFTDAKEVLLSAAKDYREKGYSGEAVQLLEFALQLEESNPFAQAKRNSDSAHNGGYL